ncbi:hypothetical protein RUND412_010879 [Rhizina undulata]
MESLPTEIIQEIVGHLSGDDLDSVRLVSRELSVVAAVFKYRTLRVPVSRKGLKHLLLVSQQPALASCVREIIYPSSCLPPVAEYESAELPFTKYGSSLDIAEVLQMARVFAKWYNKKMYSPQTKLEDSGECVAALEAALPRMSNIRVLQPCFYQGLDSVRDAFDKWRGTQIGIRRRAIIDMEWDIVWVHAFSTRETWGSKVRGAKQILDLIDVSNRVGLKPQSFAIGSSITREFPALLPTFFAHSSRVLRNCAPLIENLTSLSLYLDGPYQSNWYTPVEDLEKTIKGGRLHKFLSLAKNLRFLSLRINFLHSQYVLDEIRQLSLLDIFGNTYIWKNLQILHLRTPKAIIDVQDLVNVLRRHSGTLDTLSLDVFSLSGGACKDRCAPLINNLTSLSLYLDGPYQSRDETNFESLEEAIKGGSLHQFLSSAPNLRFLSLRINFWDLYYVERPLSLLDIFGNTCAWKYLHTLHFRSSNTIIDVEELANVLRRHSGTLDSLSLDVYSLSGGTCRDLLDSLKEQLHLTQFYPMFYREQIMMRNPYSRKELDRMMAYVLHGGPAFPPTAIELEEERLKLGAHGDENGCYIL